MKFLHTADLHLGKTVNGFSMIPDQKYALEQILALLEEKQADALLIAGDVYDRSIPTEEAVNLLDWFLLELAGRKIPAFIISGNHDSDDRLNFGSRLMEASGIHIAGKYQGSIPEETLSDEYGPVHIWMLPFVKGSVIAHFSEDDSLSASYEKAVRAAIARENIDTSERNVLIAHQFVTGSGQTDPVLSGSELATLNVGTVEKIDASVFSAFDYTALGHIHGAQKVGSGNVFYSGSPLKYSLREISQKKSVTLVNLRKKGEVSTEQIPIKPLHEMIHLTGSMREILDSEEESNHYDYVYATLTDADLVPDAMDTLRKYFPNAMKLDYKRTSAGLEESVFSGTDMKKMSFDEILSSFFERTTGAEPSAEQWEILKDAAKEAGIIQ